MKTVLVFVPFSRYIFKQMIGGVMKFFAGRMKVQVIEACANASHLRSLLNFWQPVGCIVEASEGVGFFTPKRFGDIPVVYLDPAKATDEMFAVIQDYAAGATLAAHELISPSMAHYAFVGYRTPSDWSHARGAAFMRAIRLNRLPFSSFERVLPGTRRNRALKKWIAALPKPCGILAANDMVAEETIDICLNLKLNIPKDIIVMGCNNDEQICLNASPLISSICPDFEKSGLLCAQLLDERLRRRALAPKRLYYGIIGFIRRNSSIPALKSDSRVMAAIRTIRARCCERLSVADVVSAMGCSTRLAEIRFRDVTGKTIRDAIADIRMEHVTILLKGGSLSIGAIAKACGYGTETALRIAFRKRFGTSMREWRAKNCRSRIFAAGTTAPAAGKR